MSTQETMLVCASYRSILINIDWFDFCHFSPFLLCNSKVHQWIVLLVCFDTNWSDFPPEPERLGRPGGGVQWGEPADDRLHGWQGLGDRLGRLQDNHTLIILKATIFWSKRTWTWSNLRFAFSFHIKQCDLENYSARINVFTKICCLVWYLCSNALQCVCLKALISCCWWRW